MTVVHVNGNHVPNLTEGISRNVESLVRSLRGLGEDAHLAAAHNSLEEMNRRRSLVMGGLRARRLALRAMADPDVDLVHDHVSLPSLALFARTPRRRKPLVVHAWNAALAPGEAAGCRGRTLHRLANGPEAAWLALAGQTDIVVSSRHQAAQLTWAKGARVHVVPNGVDTAMFRPAARGERDEAQRTFGVHGDPVVLYYGHLSPWKGLDTLVDALPALFAGAPDASALLSVTGYGGDGSALVSRLAERRILGKVALRGPSEVRALHEAADIAVVPARAAVGTACHPNVLLESMAAGLAIVASDVGSIPEIVQHGRNGLLVPPGDPAALATALRMLADDPVLRRRLGRAARDTVVASFGWDRAARAMRDVYRVAGAPVAPQVIPISTKTLETTT